jgi:FlaA1/EpsC-like NDP-sugar epimerase
VLILDMGQPVRILDVARQLVEQSGRDVEIVFTGLREGEKPHEHLYGDGETTFRPVHPLVSHVAAPALPVQRVREVRLDLPAPEMVEQLVSLSGALMTGGGTPRLTAAAGDGSRRGPLRNG